MKREDCLKLAKTHEENVLARTTMLVIVVNLVPKDSTGNQPRMNVTVGSKWVIEFNRTLDLSILDCDCSKIGSEPSSDGSKVVFECNGSGKCSCKKGYVGQKCSDCAPTYFKSNEDNHHSECKGNWFSFT